MKRAIQIACVVAAVVAVLGSGAMALEIETVPVGDPGNVDDTHGDGYGAVPYTYNIGKYEVTNAQYCEFLNAVAKSDPYRLYNVEWMGGGWTDTGGITRGGSSGSFTYTVRSKRGNRPVNYVSWGDAARFANWLHNGQPSGEQNDGTTEDGAYDLDGATSGADLIAVSREADWKWGVPSDDEWYKAAYYKGGGTNAGYWDYPTQSDGRPTAERPAGTDLVNGSANFYDSGYVNNTYYTTEVGAYDAKPSDSAYGTFDQGGNISEWTDAVTGSARSVRGGSYGSAGPNLQAHDANLKCGPTYESYAIGFRVAQIPEPATLGMLALLALSLPKRGGQAAKGRVFG